VRTSFHRSIGQSISTADEVYYEILIFWMDSFVSVCLILLKGEQEMVRLGRWSGAQGGTTENWFQYDGLLGPIRSFRMEGHIGALLLFSQKQKKSFFVLIKTKEELYCC